MTELARRAWWDPEPTVGRTVVRYGRPYTRTPDGWADEDGTVVAATWLALFEVGGLSDWVGLVSEEPDA